MAEGNLTPLNPQDPVPKPGDGARQDPAHRNGYGDPHRNGKYSPYSAVLDATPDSMSLLKALRHRWLLAVTLGLVVAAIATAATWYLYPQTKSTYRAYALVRIYPAIGMLGSSDQMRADYNYYRGTQTDLMRTRQVIRAALKQPEAAQLDCVKNDADGVLNWLEKDIKAEFPTGSEIMRIELAGANEKDVRVLVDAIVAGYMQEVVGKEHDDKLAAVRTLERIEKELIAKQTDLNNTTAEQTDRDKAFGEYQAFQNLLTEIEVKAIQQAVRVNSVNKQQGVKSKLKVSQLLVNDAVDKDDLVQKYRNQIAKMQDNRKELIKLSARPKEDLAELDEQIHEVTKKLDDRLAKLRPEVENRLRESAVAALRDQADRAQEELDYLKGQKKEINDVVARRILKMKGMKDELLSQELRNAKKERLKSIISFVGDQKETLKVELNARKRAELVQGATIAPSSSYNREGKTVAAVAVSTFIFVVLCVSWWEFRSRRIHSADELTRTLGFHVLGTMPALPQKILTNPGGVDGARYFYWQNLLTQSIDGIRTLLLHEAEALSARVIMVVSAVGREGKTTLSNHLASSIARAGKKTLLIDGDLIRPSANKTFDQALTPGLCEVLRGQTEPSDVLLPTQVSGLWVVTAGQVDRAAIQKLAQDELEKLLVRWKAEFDYIIVDSSPVLPVAHTLLIAKQVDAAVLAIMHDTSRLPPVFAACSRLTNLGVHIIGAVFSKANDELHGYGYYSYGYRYYLPQDQTP